MPYRLIDHTADFGLHVFGTSPQELFCEAARGMFEQITDLRDLVGDDTQTIAVDGADWPDLMVNWLRELLYAWSGHGFLLKRTEIEAITETGLIARAWMDRYDPSRHRVKNEIKAVTYHQIEVISDSPGWEAKIIFDV